MSDIKYEVINKCFDGVSIVAYTVRNNEGNTKLVPVLDVVKLARSGKLSNATYILDILSGEYLLKLESDLDSLDTIYKNNKIQLTLSCRILDSNGVCIGYKAIDNNKKRYTLSAKKTWELAFNKSVVGVKACMINNCKTLISTDDFDLSALPKIKSS